VTKCGYSFQAAVEDTSPACEVPAQRLLLALEQPPPRLQPVVSALLPAGAPLKVLHLSFGRTRMQGPAGAAGDTDWRCDELAATTRLELSWQDSATSDAPRSSVEAVLRGVLHQAVAAGVEEVAVCGPKPGPRDAIVGQLSAHFAPLLPGEEWVPAADAEEVEEADEAVDAYSPFAGGFKALSAHRGTLKTLTLKECGVRDFPGGAWLTGWVLPPARLPICPPACLLPAADCLLPASCCLLPASCCLLPAARPADLLRLPVPMLHLPAISPSSAVHLHHWPKLPVLAP